MHNIQLKDITFIIVTYKSESVIKKCLLNLPIESKKIIIENSNNKIFKKNLEKNFKNLKCYLTRENLGYGMANNYGAQKAKTEYIFILNPDVIVDSEPFNKFLNILNNVKFDLAAPIDFSEKNNYNFKENIKIDVNHVKGFAMILKKNYFLKYLFDKNIFLYLEEIDLCKRIKKNFGKIILINYCVRHIGGNSHGNKNDLEMEKSRNWHWMWSKFYFYKKYYGYLYGFLITFPNFINCLAKYFLFKILFNKKKKIKYKMRFLGLLNSYLLKNSYYRPYSDI